MKLIVALALPLLAAAPAIAQAPKTIPGAHDRARVTAGTYQADPAHTQVNWRVEHLASASSTDRSPIRPVRWSLIRQSPAPRV